MKQNVRFLVSIGSELPPTPNTPVGICIPTGGTFENRDIEFETDGENPLKDAVDALASEIKNTTYHIWYWWWMPQISQLRLPV